MNSEKEASEEYISLLREWLEELRSKFNDQLEIQKALLGYLGVEVIKTPVRSRYIIRDKE